MAKSFLAWSLLVVLPACAHAQAGPASSPVPAAVPTFTRQLAPFPVHDSTGRSIAEAFLGGLDVPRPQLLDIDGNGRLDLFVQERSGEVMRFERDGDRWAWRTDRFADADVGEWYRFVDLDGDGDWDLLGESRFSYVKAWQNTGTATEPRFAVWADSLRDNEGRPLFADRQNILNLIDIDCNNRLDLFIGKVEGVVDRYEVVDAGPDGLPRFALVAHRWEGIEIIGGTPSGPSRPSLHGANTMTFGDVDGDGDADLLWGDFFEPGLLLIRNDGTSCQTPALGGTPIPFPRNAPIANSGYNAPSLADADGDGDLDLVMGVIGGAFGPRTSSTDNLYLLEQVASEEFATRTTRLIPMIDVGSESAPALADLDGDGDLDLLVGSKIHPVSDGSAISWFENTGSTTAPAFHDRGELVERFEYQSTPAVGDLDGDGLLDLVIGSWRDRVQWWKHTGSRSAPAWTLADSALVTITRGSNTTPTLGDLDGDGDLDLVIGEASGQLNLYRNTGTRVAPAFELVSDGFQGIDVGRRSAPLLVDVDGDGRLDLLIGSEDGVIHLWRHVGNGAEIRFEQVQGFAVATDAYAAPAAGDLDGDGVLDLVVGVVSGGLRYFRGAR